MKLTVEYAGPKHPKQVKIFSNVDELEGEWDDIYVNLSGYCGPYKPELFAAAPELLAALRSVRPLVADMARSWEFEAQQLKRIDALIAKAEGK